MWHNYTGMIVNTIYEECIFLCCWMDNLKVTKSILGHLRQVTPQIVCILVVAFPLIKRWRILLYMLLRLIMNLIVLLGFGLPHLPQQIGLFLSSTFHSFIMWCRVLHSECRHFTQMKAGDCPVIKYTKGSWPHTRAKNTVFLPRLYWFS